MALLLSLLHVHNVQISAASGTVCHALSILRRRFVGMLLHHPEGEAVMVPQEFIRDMLFKHLLQP
jgi:hypothetical protein